MQYFFGQILYKYFCSSLIYEEPFDSVVSSTAHILKSATLTTVLPPQNDLLFFIYFPVINNNLVTLTQVKWHTQKEKQSPVQNWLCTRETINLHSSFPEKELPILNIPNHLGSFFFFFFQHQRKREDYAVNTEEIPPGTSVKPQQYFSVSLSVLGELSWAN